MAKFRLYLGRDRLYRWHLVANNGQIVAWAEGYTTKQSAIDSINFVKINSKQSPIVDDTK